MSFNALTTYFKETIGALFFILIIDLILYGLIFNQPLLSVTLLKTIQGYEVPLQLFAYIMLLGYGALIGIIRQLFFDDGLKENYEHASEEFISLRSCVISKLKKEYPDLRKIYMNDYLLYQTLGKYITSTRYAKEANQIAYYALGSLLALLVHSIYLGVLYGFFPLLIGLFIIIIMVLCLSNVVKNTIEKRYIARNTRLYLSYLTEEKKAPKACED